MKEKNEIIFTGEESKELDNSIERYLELKKTKDEADKAMTKILSSWEEMIGVSPDEPKTGSVNLVGADKKVKVEFKMTKSINRDFAIKECEKNNLNILDLFNVKLDYPKQGNLDVIEHWNEKDKGIALSIIESATTTKRTKSGVVIK